jgi:hypothetical protein
MVGGDVGAQDYPGKRVDLVCPRCDYVIANFTADELVRERTKAKRYRALTTRQQFCGGCMCTVRKLDAVWDGGGERR